MSAAALTCAWLGRVDYEQALRLQEALAAARQADSAADLLLLLEHPHVYTLGRGAAEEYLIAPPPEVPVYRVSRGGQVTYHGPGQLVGYPIVKLEGAARDVHAYMRSLEAAIIAALSEYGIQARRRDRLTGVWVGERKIASIGVGIRRWTTMHGFALNVRTELGYFDAIVPCGIHGCRMTSMARETGRAIDTASAAERLAPHFAAAFGRTARWVSAAQVWDIAGGAIESGVEAKID